MSDTITNEIRHRQVAKNKQVSEKKNLNKNLCQ